MLNRLSDHWIALALVLYTLSITIWLLVNGVRVTLEDGFYYFKIAQNIAQGAGSTFDGFNLTNGYHPLWLFSLVPLFWLTSAPGTALALGIALQAVFMAATVVLLYYTARFSVGRFAASLAALLWVLLTYPVFLGGLEFSLHALGLLVTAYVYLRWFAKESPQQPLPYLVLGLLLSLAFLTRLDTILLAGIIGWVLAWRELKGGLALMGIQRLLALGLPVLLVCLVYGGANLFLFGYLFPVSSFVKRTWSAYLLTQDPLYLKYGWLTAKAYHLLWPLRHLNQLFPLSLALGTFGAGTLWLFGAWGPRDGSWRDWLNQILQPWQPFVWFSLLNFLSYVLLYHQYLSFPAWYYVIQPCLTALLVAAFMDKCGRELAQKAGPLLIRVRWLVLVGMIGVWCSVPLYTIWQLEQWRSGDYLGVSPQPLYDGAQWIRANLPADTVVGAWNAGAIGYLSERRVVNLDGLVNSWEYYQTERYDLCRYWQETGITYVVDLFDHRAEPNQAVVPEPTYLHYAQCADRLELIWLDQRYVTSWWRLEVYKIRPLDN